MRFSLTERSLYAMALLCYQREVLRLVRPLVAAAVLLVAGAASSEAQVFLASRPHPDFKIGPLFVVVNVRPDLGPVTITLAWSLAPEPGHGAAAIKQDLFLLWPGEISEATAEGDADPTLRPYVEQRGFSVISSGRLVLRSRDRMQLGTTNPGDAVNEVASFVTFVRPGPVQAGPGSFIKVPWSAKLADPLAVMSLGMSFRNVIGPKPATWWEELFWGRRYVLATGFGDVGSLALPLYPLYFEHRDRVVPLAREFSLVIATFADSDHLRIEQIEPGSATRRQSRVRTGAEVVSMPLVAAEGISPQTLKVQFSYFSGRIAWRPVLVSLVLLLLGNVAGFLLLSKDVTHFMRSRLALRRPEPAFVRDGGMALPRDVVDTIVPGSTTRAEVLARWGPPDEERVRRGPNANHILIYRAARRVPRPRLAVGRLTTVARWDHETHELEIELNSERVSAVQSRVSRTRAAG